MSWQNVSRRIIAALRALVPTKRAGAPSPKRFHLDRTLVNRLRSRRVPGWSQIKYVRQFLTTKEKRSLAASLIIATAAAVSLFGFFLYQHIQTVPTNGGEYTEAVVGQPKYLNPLYAMNNDVDQDIVSLLYAPLFTYTASGTLTPELAENYSVGSDQKTYIITLRQKNTWSDGEPMSADDVIFTWETLANQEVGSSLYAAFQGIKIEKLANQTIRFTLPQPFAPFLSSLAQVGILPEHVWSSVPPASFKLAKQNIQPGAVSGPWQFSKLVKDDLGNIKTYSLTPNPNYWGPKPHIERLTFKFFPDYDQALESLQSRAADGLSFAPRRDNKNFTSRDLATYTLQLPQYTALFFNQKEQPILKADAMRQALALGTDKVAVAAAALLQAAQVINGPLLPSQLGFHDGLKTWKFNRDEANKLLDKDWPRLEPGEFFTLQYNSLIKKIQPAPEPNKKKASSKTVATATSTPLTAEQAKAIDAATNTIRQSMDATQTFYRKNKANQILSLTITTLDAPEYSAAAEALAKQWRALGIKMSVQLVGARQIAREILHNHSYQVLLYGEVVGADSDLFPFWHSSQIDYPGLNLALFADRGADQLLTEGRQTLDQKQRADKYKKFQDILADKLPAIFLYTPQHSFVINKGVKGVTIGVVVAPSDRYKTIASWYLKTKWRWK